MKINQSLLNRLAMKRAGKYKSPFRKGGMLQGTPHKAGGHWLRWSETPEDWSELKGRADELLESVQHQGWYLDGFGDAVVFGIVRKVRMRGGVRFLAAISDPFNGDKYGNGPALVEVHEDGSPLWYDDAREAARASDQIAQQYAEREREYQEGWRERNDAEEAADEMQAAIKTARKEARELIAGIRQSTLAPSLCERMRREVTRLREESAEAWGRLRESRKTMERLKEFA